MQSAREPPHPRVIDSDSQCLRRATTSEMSNSALKQLHLEAKSRKGQGGGVPRALPKPQPQGGPRRHRSFTRKTPAQKA